MDIKEYGLIGLAFALLISLTLLAISRAQINKLQGQVMLLEQQKQELIDTNNIFRQKVEIQNSAILSLQTEARAARVKYDEVMNRMKPTFEKREEKIKVIDQVEVTSDECKSLQNIIDVARKND